MIRQSSVTPMKKALLFGFITGANNRAGIGKPNEIIEMTKLTITIVVIALMSGCADMNYMATEMMAPNYSSGPRNPDAPESGVELLVRDNWTLWSGWTDWYHVAYFDTLDECMASVPTYLEANQGGQAFCAGSESPGPVGLRAAKRYLRAINE